MKRVLAVSILGLGLIAPSVSLACGMYMPQLVEGKKVVLADALDAIDSEDDGVKKEPAVETPEVKPTEAKVKSEEASTGEKKPNA